LTPLGRLTAASWCTTSTASGRPQWLDGPEDSPELRRARELRPVVDAADHVLDLHSTNADVVPFWVYPAFARNAAAALAIGPAICAIL
jgi:predicted deacylase